MLTDFLPLINLVNSLSPPDISQLGLAKSAVLVLEFSQNPVAKFLVRQATATAQELATGFPMPLTGATIDQLPLPFSSPELADQLHRALHSETPAPFQLTCLHPPESAFRTYACQLLRINEQQLVLSLDVIDPGPEAHLELEKVLETMPLGLIVFQAVRNDNQAIVDFQAIRCNQVGAKLSGQSHQAILTRPISQRYPDRQANELFQKYIAVVTSGKPHQQLVYLPPQDIWLDVSVVKYRDGLLVAFQDVTIGQKTASLLESVMSSSPASVRYYETIRDSTTGLIIDFMTSTGNELAAYRHFRPSQSTTGQRMLELYPYLKTNGTFDRYVAVVESGESDHFETVYQLDTNTTWFDCTAVRHGNGFVLTTLDITPFKLAQLDLERQTELTAGVLNSSSSSIIVLEPLVDQAGQIADFRISLANPATLLLFSRFVGREFTQDDLLQQTLLMLFPASKERDVFSALIAVVSTGQSIHQAVDYPALGVAYDYDLTLFRTGVLMITTDITPLRAYQQKLEANNAALSRTNEYLQQFAYVASHDLQEPLRKIQSFGDLLLTQYAGALDETGRDLLQRMQNAALRMQTLVKDLLNYSRLTTQPANFQPVSLQPLVQEVLSDMETMVKDTRAMITIGRLPVIPGDATQLRQLIQNLMANALKFTKPGQPPQVRLDAALLKVDQLPEFDRSTASRRWVALTIADDGIGFDEAYQEQIFKLFHRLHGRSQYVGTGIGLAVVKKVVENHRGFITVDSQVGLGTTFTVYLPLA